MSLGFPLSNLMSDGAGGKGRCFSFQHQSSCSIPTGCSFGHVVRKEEELTTVEPKQPATSVSKEQQTVQPVSKDQAAQTPPCQDGTHQGQ